MTKLPAGFTLLSTYSGWKKPSFSEAEVSVCAGWSAKGSKGKLTPPLSPRRFNDFWDVCFAVDVVERLEDPRNT
jgi:hypothetical protein